jgi:hypothetical protein
MGNNNTEKNMPMKGRKVGTAVEPDRRFIQEINILKLEGSLFCFDPREAKRRRGVLSLEDARKQPVSVEIHPDWGQPSVTAYKVLQAIFLKLAEQGCTLTEDGRCIHSEELAFSHRELVALMGRSWTGKISEELYRAIKQLQYTGVNAYLLINKEWELKTVNVVHSPLFAGEGNKILIVQLTHLAFSQRFRCFRRCRRHSRPRWGTRRCRALPPADPRREAAVANASDGQSGIKLLG